MVVKKADSRYVTNSRDADWIKVKPEYADQMGEVSNRNLAFVVNWSEL